MLIQWGPTTSFWVCLGLKEPICSGRGAGMADVPLNWSSGGHNVFAQVGCVSKVALVSGC